MDKAEILHFNSNTYKIWMQKFCRAIFSLNSWKNQQQIDNAEILHLNFDTFKIWMQKFCRASFRQIHYKNNEQVLKTSGFDVLSSRKKLQKTLEGETSPPPPHPPPALIRPRVKNEIPHCKL